MVEQTIAEFNTEFEASVFFFHSFHNKWQGCFWKLQFENFSACWITLRAFLLSAAYLNNFLGFSGKLYKKLKNIFEKVFFFLLSIVSHSRFCSENKKCCFSYLAMAFQAKYSTVCMLWMCNDTGVWTTGDQFALLLLRWGHGASSPLFPVRRILSPSE